MRDVTGASDEYLAAFLDGFEFALLALEGRMDLMDEAAAEELAPFIADYRRLGELLRARGVKPPSGERRPRVRVKARRIPVVELTPGTAN
ncbi:MAG TPA: hypothetical protein VNZ52_15495 [Candidatus Thermoplasmatota archaeon]|nr:hypothetical protein [Candidatus Thermoplasmatota archaeon]